MINRGIFALVLAVMLAACATGPRPDSGSMSKPAAPVSAPLAAAEPDPMPEAMAPEPAVSEVAPAEAMAPQVVTQEPLKPSSPAAQAQPKPRAQTVPVPPKPVENVPPKPPVEAKPALKPEPNVESASSTLSGRLVLAAGSGQQISAEEMSQAAVYYVPDAGGLPAQPGMFRIYTHNKEFEPASMVVPLGSTITFPNQDEILHNVFSVTPRSSFDLGVYGEGKSAEYSFKRTGLVLINCNVHHAMQANVLVIDTPYYTSPDPGGRFALKDLPAGSGKLMIWHPRANVKEMIVRVPSSGSLDLNLLLTKPRVSEHLNKSNKTY